MLILHKSFVCFIFEMVFRNGVLLLTDKIQVYFDRFHRVGMASCYILPHLPSMFYLGILSGSDIWNRHRALKCTCHHCYMAMMHTNFAFHNVCLRMKQIKQLSDCFSHIMTIILALAICQIAYQCILGHMSIHIPEVTSNGMIQRFDMVPNRMHSAPRFRTMKL